MACAASSITTTSKVPLDSRSSIPPPLSDSVHPTTEASRTSRAARRSLTRASVKESYSATVDEMDFSTRFSSRTSSTFGETATPLAAKRTTRGRKRAPSEPRSPVSRIRPSTSSTAEFDGAQTRIRWGLKASLRWREWCVTCSTLNPPPPWPNSAVRRWTHGLPDSLDVAKASSGEKRAGSRGSDEPPVGLAADKTLRRLSSV